MQFKEQIIWKFMTPSWEDWNMTRVRKYYIGNQSSCNLWYRIAVCPSTSSTMLPWLKLQSHLHQQKLKTSERQLNIFPVSQPKKLRTTQTERRLIQFLLISSFVHPHDKLKNCITRSIHNTNCLHSSAAALWLHMSISFLY